MCVFDCADGEKDFNLLYATSYHFAGSEGVFYAREPYVNPDATHVTRFIGLGAVGNDNKQVKHRHL
jgi:hypothetical protein